jgi:plastocyanin
VGPGLDQKDESMVKRVAVRARDDHDGRGTQVAPCHASTDAEGILHHRVAVTRRVVHLRHGNVRRPSVVVLGLIVGILALAACGGDDDSAAPPAPIPADAVTVHAADINFPTKEFTAKAGTVTFVYIDQPGVIPHTLEIEGVSKNAFYLKVSGAGDQAVGSVVLQPGTYTIFCDIPGHRAAGMEGTVTVS